MSLGIPFEINSATGGSDYSVRNSDGVTYINGSMPVSQFAALAKGQRKAVMSAHLARLARCNFAWGTTDDVDRAIAHLTAEWDRTHPKATALERWCEVGRRGASSDAMAHALGGMRCNDPKAHPHDPDDFSRCLWLLNAVPELRPQLPTMAGVSPVWAELVQAWDAIEALFMEEVGPVWLPDFKPRKRGKVDRTYAAIRAAIDRAAAGPA